MFVSCTGPPVHKRKYLELGSPENALFSCKYTAFYALTEFRCTHRILNFRCIPACKASGTGQQ